MDTFIEMRLFRFSTSSSVSFGKSFITIKGTKFQVQILPTKQKLGSDSLT